VRKTSQAFGRGRLTFLRPGNRKILAYLREIGEESILCVANLGRSAQPVELDLKSYRGRVPVEMMGRTSFPPVGELPYMLTLPACSFYWFRLATDVEVPRWHEEHLAREDLPVLVLFDGWSSLFRDRVVPWRIGMAEKVRAQFEQEVLPRYIEIQRWYGAKGEPVKRARLADHALWQSGRNSWMLGLTEVEGGPEAATYFVPLALAWEDSEEERMRTLASVTVAKVRQQANVGVLADALGDEAFCRAVVEAIGAGHEMKTAHGKIRFTPTRAYGELAGKFPAALAVSRAKAQSSNTILTIGERLFLKGYRRLRPGINPELEVGRFLTEAAHFKNCVPVAGAVEYTGADGTPMTLAMLQAYVPNQGDGWAYTIDYLQRFLDRWRTSAEPPPADAHGGYLSLINTLGTRTAELHCALALTGGDAAFDPEPVKPEDVAQWRKRVRDEAVATLELLERRLGELTLPVRNDANTLIASRDRILERIAGGGAAGGQRVKTRFHGDYHLGQVLLSKNDFLIIDFEGEPARPLEERRQKHSPLKDVAGMLRSFNYAHWTALRNGIQGRDDTARLAPLAQAWEEQTRREFLAAYEAAVGSGDVYTSFSEVRGLLELFELEKALYELRYEINNRPGWVDIPLRGIIALVGLA
jgi:maltose alpha-D-glucosyltransferase / alpha-amylase